MIYDYEIIEEKAEKEIFLEEYITLDKFLRKFVEGNNPEDDDFIKFCQKEGYDYRILYKKSHVRHEMTYNYKIKNKKDSKKAECEANIRAFYIYVGTGVEKLDNLDDYIAIVSPIKLRHKKIRRVSGMSIYRDIAKGVSLEEKTEYRVIVNPKVSLEGHIMVPKGVSDIPSYIKKHLPDIDYGEPVFDFSEAEFDIKEEEAELER